MPLTPFYLNSFADTILLELLSVRCNLCMNMFLSADLLSTGVFPDASLGSVIDAVGFDAIYGMFIFVFSGMRDNEKRRPSFQFRYVSFIDAAARMR